MALDVGDRRVGVAVSDPIGIVAQGLDTIHRSRKVEADVTVFANLVREYEVERIVVGWPLESSGRPGGQARKVEKFVEALQTQIEIPFERWDERMTTAIAERVLIEAGERRAKRKQVIDKVAAILILQSWLDAQSR
jgi:putative Holliday junction resolvase